MTVARIKMQKAQKDVVSEKEEINYNNIIKKYKND